MKQYQMFELTLEGPVLDRNWAQIDLEAVFSQGSREIAVRGFYAGEGKYRIRFLPESTGVWNWQVRGLLTAEGSEECVEGGSCSLVRAAGTHFEKADGSLFRPFGTTVYALIHQEPELIARTMDTLRESPFSKVRLCVFPKHYRYNANEPQWYPFEKKADGTWDVNRPCFAFWDHLDARLEELDRAGIQADLILFHCYDRWGFASLSREENLIYLDYLIRRLAAHPNVWWSLANEYDLCLEHKSITDWEEIEAFMAARDPFRHLLSCHNCFQPWDFSRPAVTHISVQTKRLAHSAAWLKQYGKPLVVDECCYEGNIAEFWGSITGEEMTARFWRVFVSGGYATHGETFCDGGDVLWWSKGGVLKGSSPSRIAFLKRIAEEIPGPVEPVRLGFSAHLLATDEELDRMIREAPPEARCFIQAARRMPYEDRRVFAEMEMEWACRCGEEVFLYYLDNRPCAGTVLRLPDTHTYRIEVIDTWNMTRETVADSASGETEVALPGRPWMAVFAKRI